MRAVRAAAAAVGVAFAAGAASVAAGRLASDAALKATSGRPLPTEPRLTVHSTAAGRITLTRAFASQRPGVYGLTGAGAGAGAGGGAHAVVGSVVSGVPHAPDTVVRRLERVSRGTLEPGDKVWFTPSTHIGDPRTALGLDHTDVEVPGELGTLPAWFVPGVRSTWVITVHGLGTTREHPMNVMGFLHRHGFPVLDVAYRGDAGAPRAPDGLSHLGETEWRDVDAAIHHAVRFGAEKVVLYGWSTGATMALRAASRSGLRDRVTGLVLDSPVLDWTAALRALATACRTPGVLLPLAVRAAQGRTGLGRTGLGRTGLGGAAAVEPARIPVPALIFHGPDDLVAPWDASRRLAAHHPGLITLSTVRQAPHGAMWNADPAHYEETLRRFLTPLM
ncbi:alpha/beta hydrolase family protein [Streptomyces sp. HM190]|uniref:alpha/beta hydrolase family protein n=1 Tax=Streptomyces sp. HM190 TaxID=2695266 RepID=UPI00135926B1|nr:alpha/beta fold hydrolase [Streptomyces sp. HM190]